MGSVAALSVTRPRRLFLRRGIARMRYEDGSEVDVAYVARYRVCFLTRVIDRKDARFSLFETYEPLRQRQVAPDHSLRYYGLLFLDDDEDHESVVFKRVCERYILGFTSVRVIYQDDRCRL